MIYVIYVKHMLCNVILDFYLLSYDLAMASDGDTGPGGTQEHTPQPPPPGSGSFRQDGKKPESQGVTLTSVSTCVPCRTAVEWSPR